MTLQKQTIPVLFEGMDTNVPSELLVPGKMELIKNGVRRKAGLVDKRFGFTTLAQAVISGVPNIAKGEYLFNYKDDLVVLDGSRGYSYLDSTNTWVDKGYCAISYTSATSVVRNSYSQAVYDTAQVNELNLTIYEDSRGGIRYTIYNTASKSYIISDALLASTGKRPKVVALDNIFIITYLVGSSFITRNILEATPTTVSTPVTVNTNATDYPTDLFAMGNYAVFAYNNTATKITVGYISHVGDVGSPAVNTFPVPVIINGEGQAGLTILAQPSSGVILVTYINTTAGFVQVTTLDISLSTQITTNLENLTAAGRNITAALSGNTLTAYGEYADTRITKMIATLNSDQTVIFNNRADLATGLGLASKVTTIAGVNYYLVAYQSVLQSMYLLASDTTFELGSHLIGRLAYGYGQGYSKDTAGTLRSYLPNMLLIASNTLTTAIGVANQVTAQNGTVLSANFGVSLASLQVRDNNYSGASFQNTYLLAGSLPKAYDGVSFFDPGFIVYPESTTVTASAGGSLLAGNYGVQVLVEWTDATGQLYQSAPSPAKTIAVLADQKLSVTVDNSMYLALKTGRSSPRLVLYRTTVGGSTLYRDVVFDIGTTAQATQADTSLRLGQILYTTGGVLENIAPPSCKVVWRHQNRMTFAGLEDPSVVQYSKEAVANIGLETTDIMVFKVDSDGVAVTALGSLDDKLILFKPSKTYFTVGDGLNSLGNQDNRSIPQEIPGSIGCEFPVSVVAYPEGLLFKSRKGYWNLSRSTGFEYIGKEVEAYNDLAVSSSIMLPDEKEIRITTKDGQALVYNHFFKQWSVFSNFRATSAAYRMGRYYHLKSDGRVNQESRAYSDNGSRISLGLETGWMSFGQVQGFQRIYNFYLLGRLVTQHILRIQFAYDYQDGWRETVDINTATALNTDSWGGSSSWGGTSLWGGDVESTTVYQWSVKPRIQKCESVKISIEDVDTLNPQQGASMRLLHMLFELGIKGADKGNNNKSRGSI